MNLHLAAARLRNILFPTILASACLFLSSGPASVAAPSSGAVTEEVAHANEGEHVGFELAARPLVVRLQGLSAKTGRWVTLATKVRPPETLSRIRIPRAWRGAELRVVADYRGPTSRRVTVPVSIDRHTRLATFVTTSGARLFSVEYKEGPGWKRISTVAATDNPKLVSVPLPRTVSDEAELRVVAVFGAGKTFPILTTPVSTTLRGGLATFASSAEVASAQPLAVADAPSDSSKSGATVEESDVWRIRGGKIYFFNRLRGLQIIDAQDPADPVMAGSLALAGSGEEMYLLDDGKSAGSALLVTTLPWSPSSTSSIRLHRIDVSRETPSVQSSLDLPGYYKESRLVGGVLHIVSVSWSSDSGEWSPRTYLTTVDVSQDGVLVEEERREFGFYAQTVGSTGKYFWIAAPRDGSWSRHRLLAFGYRTDGSLADPLQADLNGSLQDKFKVGDTADGLAAVVQDWDTQNWQRVTRVQTFRALGDSFVAAAELELVRNESLFATRFHHDRLYAVTFEQIDPLWIVDLADPSEPQIKGHLEVPGWSTFIQPLGDVLVAVGRDGGKVQVSMFDVADPGNPSLARRIDVGGGAEGWAWSEAEWNEKAVKILPEAGLILLPVVEWSQGIRSDRVSLIDFDATERTLELRGTIDHDFSPRRAALMEGDIIASVSNRELLLVDAADRGAPVVTAERMLAFGVDRLVVHNNTAIMIENGGHAWAGSPTAAVLRTAPSADPENVIAEVPLASQAVVAAGIFGDRLVLVEKRQHIAGFHGLFAAPDFSANSRISVWSLQDASLPSLVGEVDLPFDVQADTQLLPVEGGRIAIASRRDGWRHWIQPRLVVGDVASSVARIGFPWIGESGQGMNLAIAEIGATPAVLGEWRLEGEEYSGLSEVFSAGDLLVFSYDRREGAAAAAKGTSSSVPVWSGGWTMWSKRSWLQIIDLADPASPMAWAPVQLPGRLLGVSWLQRAGGVVLTRSGERVAALGFDGENASVVAEVAAGSVVAVQGSTLYSVEDDGVSEWIFNEDSGKWLKGPGWIFDPGDRIGDLHVADGALLAANPRSLWVLREDLSVSSNDAPAGTVLSLAAAAGEGSFLVPAGEYGPVILR